MTEEKTTEPSPDRAPSPGEAIAQQATQPAQPVGEPVDAADAPPPPEPLTPERAAAENRRNDLFIAAAIIVTAFLVGSFRVTDSEIWLRLRSGWQIAQGGVPETDPFAYPTADRRWINLQWLFDRAMYQVEVTEARSRARNIAGELADLVAKGSTSEETANETSSAEAKQRVETAIADLQQSLDAGDTHSIRDAVARAIDEARDAGLALPSGPSDQTSYDELMRYAGPGGATLVSLAPAVIAKSLVLAAAIAVFLLIRRRGPTLWWSAVVAAWMLVAMSDRLTLSPEVMSLFLATLTFGIIQQYQFGRTWAVGLLIPVTLLWVNVDKMFVLALVLPAIVLVCELLARATARTGSPATWEPSGNPAALAGAIVISGLASLANPFVVQAWTVPWEWTREVVSRGPYVAAQFVRLFGAEPEWVKNVIEQGDSLASLAPDLIPPFSAPFILSFTWAIHLPALFAFLLIVAAVVSFFMNRKSVPAWRVVVFVGALAMFIFGYRYVTFVTLASGVVLALNGHEWFLNRYGTETRITRGWLIWSQGGRAATLLLLTLVAGVSITGWLGDGGNREFGYGIHWPRFELATGRFLRKAELVGQPLNTVPAQGNLLIWSNYPQKQVFIDSREMLHHDRLDDFNVLKKALRDDERELWEPVLDQYNISHVILNRSPSVDAVTFFRTYEVMLQSKNWTLVHFDSANAIFGRIVPDDHRLAADANWFRANAFKPAELAFKEKAEPLPDPPVPVAPPTFIDWLWRTRRFASTESVLAGHLLNARLTADEANQTMIPPENCFLAIRAARQGLAKQMRPSSQGYAALKEAYLYLLNIELAQAPNPEVHELRLLELLAALNQLVAADPDSVPGHLQLAYRYAQLNFIDLADEHFEAVIRLMPFDSHVVMFDAGQQIELTVSDIISMSERLKLEIERARNDADQLAAQLTSPIARANYLLRRGLPGTAIQELTEAAALSLSPGDISPTLANLYIRTGQAGDLDRGAERELRNLQGLGGIKASLMSEMWGTVKLMQGDYEHSRRFFEDAIAETRHGLARDALQIVTQQLRQGAMIGMALTPASLVEDSEYQARLEFHLGMVQLEAGEPAEAARHFKRALSIREDALFRPVIGFYLERITGEKLEPLPTPPADDQPAEGAEKPAGAQPTEPVVPPSSTERAVEKSDRPNQKVEGKDQPAPKDEPPAKKSDSKAEPAEKEEDVEKQSSPPAEKAAPSAEKSDSPAPQPGKAESN